jgi:hypothetical protein
LIDKENQKLELNEVENSIATGDQQKLKLLQNMIQQD